MKTLVILMCIIIGLLVPAWGQSWEWLNPYPTGLEINQVYFLNANVGFVLGQGGTLLRSEDGGDTWEQANAATDVYFFKMIFPEASYGWVIGRDYYYSGSRVFATTDGGMTWFEQFLPSTYGTATDIFFLDTQHGWVVGEYGLIFRTTDGGNSWIDKSITGGDNPNFYSVHFNTTSEGMALGRSGYNYRFLVAQTNDGGDSWNMQTSGLQNTIWDADQLENSTFIGVGDQGLVLKTADAGQTWSFPMGLPSGSLLAVDFYDPLLGMAVGEEANMIKTSDGGATWSQVLSGFSIPLRSVQFISEDTIYSGGSGYYYPNTGLGILVSSDGGNIWTNKARFIDQSFSIQGLCFSSAQKGWVAGDNYIYGTTDGGYSWNLLRFNNSEYIRDMVSIDSLTVFAVGEHSGQALVLKTTNGGSTWQTQTYSNFYSLNRVSFPNADTGYAVGDNGACLKTTNGGLSWSALNTGTTNYYIDVEFATADMGWICGGDNQVRKTTDGGASWNTYPVTPNIYDYIRTLSFPDANTGYAAKDYGEVYKSTNGGISWTLLPGYFSDIRDAVFMNANSGWMVTYDGIMATTDGGSTWLTQFSYSESNRLAVLPNVGLWVGGYNTSILKYSGGPIVGITGEQPNAAPEKFSLSQNYPNPFNPVTNIRFGLPRPSHVKIEIFNVLGQRVITLMDEKQSAGYHVITFDASRQGALASGMYFYRIEAGEFTDTKRMLLVK